MIVILAAIGAANQYQRGDLPIESSRRVAATA